MNTSSANSLNETAVPESRDQGSPGRDSFDRDSFDPNPSVPNRKLPAWMLSCGFHTLILVGLVLVIGNYRGGAGDVEAKSGGIVLVDMTTETTEYLSEGDQSDSSASAAAEQSPPPLPSDTELPPDLPGAMSAPATITGVGEDLMESLPGVDSLLDGTESFEVGGKVTTEVFGVKGTGSKFLYVFDRSKSMEGYERRPLLAARRALKTSLASLGKVQQFQIVFYNDKIRVFDNGSGPKMFFATEENKQSGVRFVDSVQGDGGTNHLAALKYALSLNPDVIFFLTDAEGGFTPAEIGAIADWNRGGTVINAIQFGIGSQNQGKDRTVQQVAQESGGQYTYKNILTLRLE